MALRVEPILARSVSTIRTPSIENLGDSYDASSRPFDEALLRRAFDVAKAAQEAGDHPFGTVLADEKGKFLIEQGSGFASEGDDRTGHAQRLLALRAARHRSLAFLARCTLYSATEPCAMCAGAIYWAGIGRVVTEVVGPLLEDEAAALQADFWKARDTHRSCVVSV